MKSVCQKHLVKFFDNYYESGVNFDSPAFSAWADELTASTAYMNGEVDPTESNKHLSPEAYLWLLPIYEEILRGM